MQSRKIINLTFIAAAVLYCFLVLYYDQAPYFNRNFAGQDARQQLFPLYDELHPGLFGDDYITRAMKLYTGPLHYFIASKIVKFTQSPILTGHCIMAIQFTLALIFIFLTTLSFSSIPAACVSAAWLLSSRGLLRNTFGGLPRGWPGAIIGIFLFLLSKKQHKSILALILIGSLLHPHSTFLVCACYGIFLLSNFLTQDKRAEIKKPFIAFLLFCPVIIAVNYYNVKRPEDIGTMYNITEAAKIPAFSISGGRFPFVPLDSPLSDFKHSAINIFMDDESRSDIAFKNYLIVFLVLFYGFVFSYQFFRQKKLVPAELIVFLVSIIVSYFLARIFAFRLYVPTRYLGWPFSIFFMTSIPIILWRFFSENKQSYRSACLALMLLVSVLYLKKGSNIGAFSKYKPGDAYDDPMYTWIRENTPSSAVFAGHPSSIDGMQLYGMRRAYITTETAHPFYDKFNAEVEKRIDTSFRALYAPDLSGFLNAVKDKKIDYFVFPRKSFALNKPGKLPTFKNAGYFLPHDKLVEKLASNPPENYFYNMLDKYPESIAYNSNEALIIEITKLPKPAN